MALTEYRRGQVVAKITEALKRAENVVPQMTAAKESVLDSRANYLAVKAICGESGLTQQQVDEQFGADFAADATVIFQKAGPQLIALLAEVSRITSTPARDALLALADAAPDTVPADQQDVSINPATGAVTFA